MSGENDVRITVDADNRTQAAFGAAARGARTVGEATDNANRSLREAANRSEAAALRLRQLALAQQAAAERAQRLSHEAAQLRAAITAAGSATSEQTQRLQHLTREQDQAAVSARLLANQHRQSTEQVNDLARAYQRAEHNAQEALRASLLFGAGARLGPDGRIIANRHGNILPGGDGDDGAGFFMRLLSHLPGLGGLAATGAGAAGSASSNPIVGTGLIALGAATAAALAPLIGGAISGAIAGGAGIGGVGLGIAGAIANDPKAFQAQWTDVIGRVEARWLKGSREWMIPLHDSIREVDAMFRKLPIESILKNSAGYLAPLTKGLTGFGEGLFAGLDSLVADAGPVIEMLSTRLPKLGADFGQFFAALGKGSEGGAVALDDLLYAVGRMTKGLGVTLGALGKMYQGTHDAAVGVIDLAGASARYSAGLLSDIPILDRYAEKVAGLFEDKPQEKVPSFARRLDGAPKIFPTTDPITGEVAKVPKIFGAATASVDEYISKIQELRDVAAGSANAQVALAQGWLDLNKELKDGKRTLDLTTQAGIDNQKALIQQAQAAEAARQGQIALNGDVAAADAAYNANIERIKAMAHALGYNDAEVDALIESLRVLDTTQAKPQVNLLGVQPSLESGYALGNLLNRIERTYYPKVQVVYGPGISLGNALHHAAGGPTSGMSVVNDWGPGTGELIRTPDGSTVIPAGTGRAMMQGLAGGGGGGGRQVIELQVHGDGTAAANYALDVLANATRIRGNGSVQLAVMGKPAPAGG